jgi:glycosyltransferase involved in cell wall biosynthesis
MKRRNTGTCCIFNFAPHYRAEIYLALEKELDCTFFFGNETFAKNLKKMDYSLFLKSPKELKFVKLLGHFNWIKGSVNLVFNRNFSKFIIVGEPFCISSWVLMIWCRLMGKSSFVWTHGWYGRESGLKKWIKKIYFTLPNGVLLYGNYAKQLMIKESFNASKLFVVYNSLAYSKQLKQRENLVISSINDIRFSKKLPVIIFIGRITVQKKLPLLMDALSLQITNGQSGFNILVIGDGNQLDDLKIYAKQIGVSEYVDFLGACYNEEEVAHRIFNADICVSPGELGLTGIHALGYGTPVITHDNFAGQMPEFEAVEPGVNGMFFIENSSSSLAQTINNWLIKYPVKSLELINNCMRVIDEKYNPQYQLQVIARALSGKSSIT